MKYLDNAPPRLRDMHENNKEGQARKLLGMLLSDSNMKEVWGRLGRQIKTNNEWLKLWQAIKIAIFDADPKRKAKQAKDEEDDLKLIAKQANNFAKLIKTVHRSEGYQILPTWDNEPGKQDRIDMGSDEAGTHHYMRMPTGKVVEDTVGWLFHAPDTFVKKMSPMAKSATESVMNDRGYGVPVEDPDGNTLTHIAQGLEHVIQAQVPYDSLRTLYDVTSGHGTKLDKAKLAGFATGFSASQGNPHGPESAVMYETEDRIKSEKAFAMEVVKRDLKYGNEDDARARLEKIGLTPREITHIINNIDSPKHGLSKQQRKKFNQHANDEELKQMGDMSN